ncbi:5-(carboxyamino)imidazole ribonucleotide mutase, partial [Clostridium botulinum]|nr:5-(carboxyamino)imidazole ribonucleotide mutase [Clostridium botulinum]
YNAGMLALEMIALKDDELRERLIEFRENMKKNFIDENGEGVEL